MLLSYTVNSVGDYVGLVALAVLVYRETRDPLATAALFVAAQFLPALIGPALTARVDQLRLRRVLPALYLGEALAFALLALLADAFSLPLVLLLAAGDGVLRITERALTRAATHATLDPRGLLREGNALFNIAFAGASVGGAALGGLLVDRLGVATALLVDAASFAVIAVVLATARALPGHARRARAAARAAPRRPAPRAHGPDRPRAARRRGDRRHALRPRRAGRDRLRAGDAADRRGGLRAAAGRLGRRHRGRQRALPRACGGARPWR